MLIGARVVLTGATGGLGQELAKALHKKGAHLFLTSRTPSSLEQFAKVLAENTPRADVAFCACNFTHTENVHNLVDQIASTFDSIDILINNAGIAFHSPIDKAIPSEIQEVFSVNVIAPIVLTSMLLPCLGAAATIVNISSVLGSHKAKNTSVYTASKHAVAGFSKALRLELAAKHIRVIQIEPGPMATEFNNNTHDPDMRGLFDSRVLAALPPDTLADLIVRALEVDVLFCLDLLRITPTAQEI